MIFMVVIYYTKYVVFKGKRRSGRHTKYMKINSKHRKKTYSIETITEGSLDIGLTSQQSL